MRSAASRIEPVSPMSASKSTLPGPRAMSSPRNTRIRGSNRGARADLVFILALECKEVNLRFQSSGKLVLAVQDDGVGLPEGLDLDSTHSLGLKMIGDLTRKVRATLNHFQNNGRTFEITLPPPVFAGTED